MTITPPVIVQLTPDEMRMGWNGAGERHLESLQSNRAPRDGYTARDEYLNEVHGCWAEIAVAKHYGLYWSPIVRSFTLPDLGAIEVKWTPYTDGKLILRHEILPHVAYVLVTGKYGRMELRGGIRGKKAAAVVELDTLNRPDRPPVPTVHPRYLTPIRPRMADARAA